MLIILNNRKYKVSGVRYIQGGKPFASATYFNPLVGWLEVRNYDTLFNLGKEYTNANTK